MVLPFSNRIQKHFFVCLVDISCILVSLICSYLLVYTVNNPIYELLPIPQSLMGLSAIQLFTFWIAGFYSTKKINQLYSGNNIYIILSVLTGILISAVITSISTTLTLGIVIQFFVLDFYFLLTGLLGVRIFHKTSSIFIDPKTQHNVKQVLIYGTNINSRMIFNKISKMTAKKYNIVGFIDDNSTSAVTKLYGYPVISDKKQLSTLLRFKNIDQIFICAEDISPEKLEKLKHLTGQKGIELIQLDVSLKDLLSVHLDSNSISSKINSAQLLTS